MNLQEKLAADNVEKGVSGIILFFAGLAPTLKTGFLTQMPELAGSENVYGEKQMKLDVWADSVIVEKLKESKLVKSIYTEEQPEVIQVPDGADYCVAIDPMDGSSNIKTNMAMGAIVGVYSGSDVLSKGEDLKASFYILFGPITTLVITWGKGVHEFVLDSKEFKLRFENIKLPEDPKVYSPGGRRGKWLPGFEKFIAELEAKGMKLRNNGSMVGDTNTILKYGGVFTYPAQTDKPNGKLRVLCECNPLGFLIEQAGGYASNGKESVLGVKPENTDQRTPIYMGNKELVKRLEEYLEG